MKNQKPKKDFKPERRNVIWWRSCSKLEHFCFFFLWAGAAVAFTNSFCWPLCRPEEAPQWFLIIITKMLAGINQPVATTGALRSPCDAAAAAPYRLITSQSDATVWSRSTPALIMPTLYWFNICLVPAGNKFTATLSPGVLRGSFFPQSETILALLDFFFFFLLYWGEKKNLYMQDYQGTISSSCATRSVLW